MRGERNPTRLETHFMLELAPGRACNAMGAGRGADHGAWHACLVPGRHIFSFLRKRLIKRGYEDHFQNHHHPHA